MTTNKLQTDKATARPWKWNSRSYGVEVESSTGDLIAEVNRLDNASEAHANAALIVRAVNEYEALCAVAETAEAFAVAFVAKYQTLINKDCEEFYALHKDFLELQSVKGTLLPKIFSTIRKV